MNVKLKPCPFCGGKAHIEDISEPDDMNAIWMIVCDECGGSASLAWTAVMQHRLKQLMHGIGGMR